jgi:hypothetical protein
MVGWTMYRESAVKVTEGAPWMARAHDLPAFERYPQP